MRMFIHVIDTSPPYCANFQSSSVNCHVTETLSLSLSLGPSLSRGKVYIYTGSVPICRFNYHLFILFKKKKKNPNRFCFREINWLILLKKTERNFLHKSFLRVLFLKIEDCEKLFIERKKNSLTIFILCFYFIEHEALWGSINALKQGNTWWFEIWTLQVLTYLMFTTDSNFQLNPWSIEIRGGCSNCFKLFNHSIDY